MKQNQLLTKEDIAGLAEISRIALREDEKSLFCRDLNELLELVSVLGSLPQDAMQRYTLQRLCDMRADAVRPEAWEPLSHAEHIEEGYFSVPSVMEKC